MSLPKEVAAWSEERGEGYLMYNLVQTFRLFFFGYSEEINMPMNIIDALLRYEESGAAAEQLVPVCKNIKCNRLRLAIRDIFMWIKKQHGAIYAEKNNIILDEPPIYFHIGNPRSLFLQDGAEPKPYVTADILLVVSAFEAKDNYFVADENNFQFEPYVSLEERERIGEKVWKEWYDRHTGIIHTQFE